LKKSIARINREYAALLADAQRRLQRQRIQFKHRKGRVQAAHVNAKGVRIDIAYDDGGFEQEVDALHVEYDPL
jgi:exonuclease III